MKKILIVLLLLTLSNYTKAQLDLNLGLNLGVTIPTGDFGKIYKPNLSYGLTLYKFQLIDEVKISVGISYARLKPRQDTFFSPPSFNPTLNDYEVFGNYNLFTFRAQGDYIILYDKAISPTVGAALVGNYSSYQYNSRGNPKYNAYENGSDNSVGLSLNAGVMYDYENLYLLQFRVGRFFTVNSDNGVNYPMYLVDFVAAINLDEF
jgi:hypothetical protein